MAVPRRLWDLAIPHKIFGTTSKSNKCHFLFDCAHAILHPIMPPLIVLLQCDTAYWEMGGVCVLVCGCRFMDRDGDGFITIDDILTAQMLMSRRNDSFLKVPPDPCPCPALKP